MKLELILTLIEHGIDWHRARTIIPSLGKLQIRNLQTLTKVQYIIISRKATERTNDLGSSSSGSSSPFYQSAPSFVRNRATSYQ